MRKRRIALIAVMVTLGLLAPCVMAASNKQKSKQPPGQSAMKEKGKSQAEHGAAKHDDRGAAKHNDKDHDQGWERREGFEVRSYGDREGLPPGWRRGNKTGWGNCGVPPGQAKKGLCRTYLYRGRRYYYYRDDLGRIIVRRPVIEVSIH